MEPKVSIRKRDGQFELIGNAEGLNALRDAIETKLKLQGNIHMTFATGQGNARGYTEIRILLVPSEPPVKEKLTVQALQRAPLQMKFGPMTFIAEIRKTSRRAYEPWTDEEDELLRERWNAFGDGRTSFRGSRVKVLASEFQRQFGGITSRLLYLNLISTEDYAAGNY